MDTNILTGEVVNGNYIIISGKYKMDIPGGLKYLRTTEIWLEREFTKIPTVVATVHHVNTRKFPTQGNAVPFAIFSVEVDFLAPRTRVMIGASNINGNLSDYEFWCEYMVMGEIV